MRDGKLLKQFRATARDAQYNLAAIGATADSLEQSVSLQTIRQLDRAVMLDLQPLGKHADGGFLCAQQAFNRQQRLMLLWLEARGASGLLAEIYKTPDLVAKFRQCLIIETGMRACFHGHLTLYRITT